MSPVEAQRDYHYKRTAESILNAAALIMKERAATYDSADGERSMAKTVLAFNAITGKQLTEVEGWLFMECLKNVRFFSNPAKPHEDSLEDCVAYASLKAEAALSREDW